MYAAALSSICESSFACPSMAAIIGIFANDDLKDAYSGMVPYVMFSVICLFIAGVAGGLIASSIPFHDSFEKFSKSKLGPWNCKWVPAILCTHIEHIAFWIGMLGGVAGLLRVTLLA